ncbi:unnamed protein product, partial [Arabidopsis halleri]
RFQFRIGVYAYYDKEKLKRKTTKVHILICRHDALNNLHSEFFTQLNQTS